MAKRNPKPPGDDNAALWQQYQAATAEVRRLRDELANRYLSVADASACALKGRLPKSVDLADLKQEARRGMVDSISRFEPGRGLQFATFASSRIRGSMLDWLRNLDHIPRLERQKIAALRKVDEQAAESALDRLPVIVDIDAPMQSSHQAQRDAAKTIAHILPDSAQAAGQRFLRQEWVRSLLRSLTLDEQTVIAGWLMYGRTLKECGQFINLSESRCSQLAAKTLARLRSQREDFLEAWPA